MAAWYEYFPGAGYSTGCTSFLYPLLLVPGFWLGLDGAALLPYVWTLAILLVAGCAWLAARLGRRVAGAPGATLAPAMLLGTGSWMWGALSGLEIALFTLLALVVVDLTFEEAASGGPTRSPASRRGRTAPGLWLAAAALALTRPEGTLFAMLAVGVALLRPERRRDPRAWVLWLAVLLPCLAVGVLNWRLTGTFAPNTAIAKSVALLPRQTPRGIAWNAVHELTLVGKSLVLGWNGLPLLALGAPLAAFGIGWLMVRVIRERSRGLALPYLLLLGGIVASTGSALTARWPGQFFRYYHPAFGLLAVSGGMAIAAGVHAAARRLPRATRRVLAAVAIALAVGWIAWQQVAWGRSFGRAAWEIRNQQVEVAHWISANLPATDRLMMNDVGAMAYFPARPIFDLCGLVTNHQARVWAEGSGAIYEKLERIPPAERAGHLIVYPEWFGLDFLLGMNLHEAALSGPLVVAGGRAAGVYEPRWSWLGSGAQPSGSLDHFTVVDAVDVADLDDEAAHGYRFAPPRHASHSAPGTIVRIDRGASDDSLADGGRVIGAFETFEVTTPAATELRLRARLESAGALDVRVDGHDAGTVGPAADSAFSETDLPLPNLAAGRHRVEVRSRRDAPYRSYHFWVLARGAAPTR